MSVNFGFSFPALAQYGGGGNNPFGQLGPTLDMSFVDGATGVTNLNDPNGYTLTTNFITPEYQVAAQYTIWETNVGLVSKTFADIITFTRASSATFVGSNGLIQSATTNTPRFDYDPVTLAAKGLLIEEQRTNLLTYSEDLTNAAWSTTGGAATVSGNVAVAPDGATTADKIVSTVATSYGVRTPVFTSTAAEYTQSAFCKAGGFNYVKFVWSSAQNATNYAVFNLTNGTITGGAYTSASITPFGNGWYRCSITSTLAAVSTYSNIWMSDGTLSRTSGVAGDGTSGILVWGAQVELGSFATSYIPTVASQVTRAVDFPAINTLSPWFNASSGSFYAEADITGTPASSRMLEVHDGTDNNRLIFYAVNSASSIRFTGVAAGVTTEAVAASSLPTSGVPFKAAGAFTAGEYVVCYNGGTVGTAAPAALPTGLSGMVLGVRRTGAQAINGHLRRVTFYPRRLSNAELQAITA